MIFNRLATSFFALILGLFAFSVAAHAQAPAKEAPKNVRSKLFKQVLADYPETRECITNEEGGARAAEENTSAFEVDLNRDGVPEYEVGIPGECDCGMVNCPIYLYRQTAGGGYELILDGASGYGLNVLKTATNGYADVRVDARDNAAVVSQTTYKFEGKQYREARAMMVHQGTGEVKPAYRRVQFTRGSSSTTLQGRASIGFPDLYLLGARAGQVMTIQLTSRRKVTFMVMTSKTTEVLADNTTSWTGTLPENGDYHILVDADDDRTSYSITISIK